MGVLSDQQSPSYVMRPIDVLQGKRIGGARIISLQKIRMI